MAVLKAKHMQKSSQNKEIKTWIVRLRKEEKSEGHVFFYLSLEFSPRICYDLLSLHIM